MLRKQSGFRDEITFAVPAELDVVAISLWDTKEYAEAYTTLQATPKCSRFWIECWTALPRCKSRM
jgi:hypothetical protein